MSAWVTAGFRTPGVRAWFGRIAPVLVTRIVPVRELGDPEVLIGDVQALPSARLTAIAATGNK